METSSVSISTDGSRRTQARLPDLSPVGIGVEPVVPDGDLAHRRLSEILDLDPIAVLSKNLKIFDDLFP